MLVGIITKMHEHWLATTGVAGLSIWSIAKVFSSKNKSE